MKNGNKYYGYAYDITIGKNPQNNYSVTIILISI